MNDDYNVFHLLIIAILGTILLTILIILFPAENLTNEPNAKLSITIAFIISCVFGISLAIKPSWIRRIFQNNKTARNTKMKSQTITHRISGHHVECNEFRGHTIKVKDQKICGGCTALAIGTVISIILILIWYVYPIKNSIWMYKGFFILGLFLIFQNIIELLLIKRQATVHFISCMFLIIGFFFVVISTYHLTGNIYFSMIGLIVTFIWLDTRIQASTWNHRIICKKCENTKCSDSQLQLH